MNARAPRRSTDPGEHRAGRGQSGATLIELVVALGAAAILLIPTLAWSVLAIQQQPITRDGLVRSADTGLLGAYLPEDIAVAGAAENDGTPPSDPEAVVVNFEDCQGGSGGGGRVVLVLLSGGVNTVRTIYTEAPGSDGGGVSVWRRTCAVDGTGTEAVEVFEDVDLGSSQAECDDGTGTTECRQIEFRTQPETGDLPVVLASTRRADPASLRVDRTGNRLPVAKIEVVSQSPGKPSNVTFRGAGSNDPDGSIASHRWQFSTSPGGPSTATVDGSGTPGDISRTFNDSGTYYVTLTVTDDAGASNVTYKAIQVDPQAPVAQGSVGPGSGIAGETTFTFDAAGSSDPDGSIVAFRWVVGVEGGSYSSASGASAWSLVVPASVVPGPAAVTLPVTLTVTDNQGRTDTWSTTILVGPPGAPPPDPDPDPDPDPEPTTTLPGDPAPVAAFTVAELGSGQWAFDAAESSDNGTIVSYAWDFGDGGTATGSTAVHLYNAPDTYQVTLTVTDDAGQTGSTTRTVAVGAT